MSFVDDRKEMTVRQGIEKRCDRLQCGPSLRTFGRADRDREDRTLLPTGLGEDRTQDAGNV